MLLRAGNRPPSPELLPVGHCILHQSFLALQRGKLPILRWECRILDRPGGPDVIRLLSLDLSGTVTTGQSELLSIGLALIPSKKTFVKPTWRVARLFLSGLACTLAAGCAGPVEFPPMEELLPSTARLEIAEPIKRLTAEYTDSCGQLARFDVGSRIEQALLEGARRNFKTVLYDMDETKGHRPDVVLKIDFVDWSFELDKDALYDRAPATLRLNVIARVYDAKGARLRETEFKVAKRERLRLEQLAKSCNYVIAPFIRDTAVELASKVFLDTRLAFHGQQIPQPAAQLPADAAGSPPSGLSPAAAGALAGTVPSLRSNLRFKAMLLDENGNLVLEGGEHVRVRVDVMNTGPYPIRNASASLTGTPSIIGQFPATTLSIPPLEPGETKSLEFVATLPPTVRSQAAEILVAVVESDGETAAPPQTLSLTIEPRGAGMDDVDQIPASATGFHRPHTYLVSLGVGAYRNRRIQPRKYAALDANTVANYFQSLGGIPSSNVRLLQDSKALRPNIDETLFDWLPSVITKGAVVIVYFSGAAMVDRTGDVFLVPYEGGPNGSALLYPLKDMELALSQLKAKQVVLLFDVKVSRLQSGSNTKAVAPRWTLAGGNTIGVICGEGFARCLEDDKHRHGLFTYYLLRGLRGEADTNRDQTVTLGEMTGYVRQKVAWAAKSQFNSEQRPQVLPILKPGDNAAALVLSKLAALAGAETP